MEKILIDILAGDHPISWGVLILCFGYAAKIGVMLYQGHWDWKRKTDQDKFDWERQSETSQDQWQRDLITSMVEGAVLNNTAVLSILSKQSDLLGEIKNLIVEGRTRRRTDFSKGEPTHVKPPTT